MVSRYAGNTALLPRGARMNKRVSTRQPVSHARKGGGLHLRPDEHLPVHQGLSLSRDQSLADSHLHTVIFTTLLATTAAYFALRKQQALLTMLVAEANERRETEEALQKSEEKFRSIVEMANEGILQIDSRLHDHLRQPENGRDARLFGRGDARPAGNRLSFYGRTRQSPKPHGGERAGSWRQI